MEVILVDESWKCAIPSRDWRRPPPKKKKKKEQYYYIYYFRMTEVLWCDDLAVREQFFNITEKTQNSRTFWISIQQQAIICDKFKYQWITRMVYSDLHFIFDLLFNFNYIDCWIIMFSVVFTGATLQTVHSLVYIFVPNRIIFKVANIHSSAHGLL